MATCPTCHQAASTRDGFDRRGRQRFACHPCHRDFTHASSSAFSGYRWPPEVIVTAVRWYLSYPLSARQVTELLAERGIDVSGRTVLTWTQTFGPQLATAARRHRRRLGRRWYIDRDHSGAGLCPGLIRADCRTGWPQQHPPDLISLRRKGRPDPRGAEHGGGEVHRLRPAPSGGRE